MPKIAGHAKSSVMALEIAVKLLIISAISCGSAIADAEKEGTKELCVGRRDQFTNQLNGLTAWEWTSLRRCVSKSLLQFSAA